MCLDGIRENLCDVLRELGRFAHVNGGSLEHIGGVDKRQVAKTTADFLLLKGRDEQPALTLLTGTSSTTETMDVGVALTGETNLDDVGDFGEIHSTGCYIRGEEDAGLCETEIICSPRTLLLSKFGVNFVASGARQRSVALEATIELVED